jgi:hypothetical protein
MHTVLGASAVEIALAVMIFTVIDLLLSRPCRWSARI